MEDSIADVRQRLSALKTKRHHDKEQQKAIIEDLSYKVTVRREQLKKARHNLSQRHYDDFLHKHAPLPEPQLFQMLFGILAATKVFELTRDLYSEEVQFSTNVIHDLEEHAAKQQALLLSDICVEIKNTECIAAKMKKVVDTQKLVIHELQDIYKELLVSKKLRELQEMRAQLRAQRSEKKVQPCDDETDASTHESTTSLSCGLVFDADTWPACSESFEESSTCLDDADTLSCQSPSMPRRTSIKSKLSLWLASRASIADERLPKPVVHDQSPVCVRNMNSIVCKVGLAPLTDETAKDMRYRNSRGDRSVQGAQTSQDAMLMLA
jgi:hypothetical protein